MSEEVPHRFLDLPPHVRKFLKNLSEEELKLTTDAIKLAAATRRVIRALAWLFVTALGSFVTGTLFVEQWSKFKSWFGGVLK